MLQNPLSLYGNIDIYLFDQLLKGTYSSCRSILDAGCGEGRNLLYFLRNGFDVYGIDADENKITELRSLTEIHSKENFIVGLVENLPFEDQKFDLLISCAVLHFAKNSEHFEEMLNEMWRVLKPGGYFFCRLASDIGIELHVRPLGNGNYQLPDGSARFLVNQEMLLRFTTKLNAELHEPIETTNVQNIRCMTTWCLRKL